MNSKALDIKTVREIQDMIDEGIAVRYIANNTGLSWWTVKNLKSGRMMNPKSVEAFEEFVKNKSYHLTKHRIKSAFKAYRYASDFLLEADGWDMFDIKRIKSKDHD